ncbi:MAG: hypothetical protein Q9174_000276 [Haloplaca sp. 1 TL-2023]
MARSIPIGASSSSAFEIASCVQTLLSNAAVTTPSSNIAFLYRLFELQKNRELLCKSSLFEWVSSTPETSHTPSACHWSPPNRTRPTPGHSYSGRSISELDEDLNLSHAFVEDEGEDRGAVANAQIVTKVTRRLSAKLHCLYGRPIQHLPRPSASSHGHDLRTNRGVTVHPYARSIVYDLRQHTERTLWGPFDDSGSHNVDWEKIEALMIILSYNIRLFSDRYGLVNSALVPLWDEPFAGATPYSLRPLPLDPGIIREPSLPLNLRDPYNVGGTWMRVVCFLDYRALFTFNFSEDQPAPGKPRPAIDTEEAIRFIVVELEVTEIEQPGASDGQSLPIVHFSGRSTSALPPVDPNANSKIRGTVRLTRENEVRWTTFSVFHGEERWRSEGIQVGGVQAARGVIGFWFDKDFDEYGREYLPEHSFED